MEAMVRRNECTHHRDHHGDQRRRRARVGCHRLIGLYGTGMHAARALGLVQGTFAGFVSRANNR